MISFPKRCYVSSKLRHKQLWLDSGLDIISSWIQGEQLSDPSELSDMWVRYFEELQDCSCLIMYLEHGDKPKGALIELGAAVAHNKPIYIIWDSTPKQLENLVGTIVHHHSVTVTTSLEFFS
jgi:hypothetical protein